MRFDEWKEFVTCPMNSARIRSREERMDTTKGFRIGTDGKYPAEFSECGTDRLAVIPISIIVQKDDIFDCMEIGDSGCVTIWTKQRVWFLAREGNDGIVEKLRYVQRNPPNG
jgi:hypothetical protein